jgi:hypothetical protein
MTFIHTNHRAIAVVATALAISAIPAPAVSARPNQSARELLHGSPAASAPASRARSASSRPSHAASAAPHGVSIISIGLLRLPRWFTTGKNRRTGAVVKVEQPVTPAYPSIF